MSIIKDNNAVDYFVSSKQNKFPELTNAVIKDMACDNKLSLAINLDTIYHESRCLIGFNTIGQYTEFGIKNRDLLFKFFKQIAKHHNLSNYYEIIYKLPKFEKLASDVVELEILSGDTRNSNYKNFWWYMTEVALKQVSIWFHNFIKDENVKSIHWLKAI